MTAIRTLTLDQARRVAISAQGLARSGRQTRPERVTMAHLSRLIERIGLLQIDSVNVLARAHLLPVFARLGPYDVGLLDRATRGTRARPRRLMEYWAHVAAYVPPTTFRLLRYRMRRYARRGFDVLRQHPDTYAQVLELVAERGPVTASQMHELLGHERQAKTHWGWNWTVAKQVLEACFRTGEIAVAYRTSQFERAYDLTERVLPPALVGAPEVDEPEAIAQLVEIAARAHGIGTVRCLADYFRMSVGETKTAVDRLVADGRLERVEVTGWPRPLFLHAEATVPRRVQARALLAPFDPLVFERRRLLELFGMHYRIGIYTPAAQRTDGYYVLPFLLGDQVVGRTDLKADRDTGALVVRSASAEQGQDTGRVGQALVAELAECARWLGLAQIVVADDATGSLVDTVRRAL